jgi:hypothetical protein
MHENLIRKVVFYKNNKSYKPPPEVKLFLDDEEDELNDKILDYVKSVLE